jgi:hypothetical protein
VEVVRVEGWAVVDEPWGPEGRFMDMVGGRLRLVVNLLILSIDVDLGPSDMEGSVKSMGYETIKEV